MKERIKNDTINLMVNIENLTDTEFKNQEEAAGLIEHTINKIVERELLNNFCKDLVEQYYNIKTNKALNDFDFKLGGFLSETNPIGKTCRNDVPLMEDYKCSEKIFNFGYTEHQARAHNLFAEFQENNKGPKVIIIDKPKDLDFSGIEKSLKSNEIKPILADFEPYIKPKKDRRRKKWETPNKYHK